MLLAYYNKKFNETTINTKQLTFDALCMLMANVMLNDKYTGYVWDIIRYDLFRNPSQSKIAKMLHHPIFKLFCHYECITRSGMNFYPSLFLNWKKIDNHGVFEILIHRLNVSHIITASLCVF
jgi:hypothetical protein